MSKSYKDKANYYKHHLEEGLPMTRKSKQKEVKENIPKKNKTSYRNFTM